MKFGKAPAEFSDHDLLFKNLMRAVPVPPFYNWDEAHPGVIVPTPMFNNDRLGCCVMSGRAHQTLRFEYAEQKQVITITDKEVEAEYLKETGGQDSGLVVSRSLNTWRRSGWRAGGKLYKIQGYSRIDLYNRSQVKAAIYSDLGVGIGFAVPTSAMKQFDDNQPWTVVPEEGSSLGGHYVFCLGYDTDWITCVTWGRRQRMSWDFWDRYTDECWAIFDARDNARRLDILNVPKLKAFLADIRA